MSLKKILVPVLLILVVGHLLYWRQYSAKVLLLKASFLVSKEKQTIYSLIGICNKLKRWSCSDFLLKHLINQFPADSLALFNLAYLEYQKKHWKLSEAYLQNYLSLVEDNSDAYLLYGKVLEKLNKPQQAVDILYWGFYINREVSLIYALAHLLNTNNLSTEALSLLVHINKSTLKSTIKFSTASSVFLPINQRELNYSKGFDQLLRTSQKNFTNNLFIHSKKPKSIRLFSFGREGFFVPIRLKKEAKPGVLQVLITKDSKKKIINTISMAFLEENYIFLQKELKVGEEINLSMLFFGPWMLKNIKFKICDNCDSTLGIKNVPNLYYHLTKKYIFYFLNVFIEKPVSQ